MGLASVGTFHERRGDQILLNDFGALPGAWARMYGDWQEQQWSSTVGGLGTGIDPKFEGNIWGVQAGLDLWGKQWKGGSHDRIGLFYTHTGSGGNVFGNALALQGIQTGTINFSADGAGANWTHIGADGWYLDAVAMGTWLSGNASSIFGLGADLNGQTFLGSLEGGYPFALADGFALEPEAQLIWQHISFGDTSDQFSNIDYSDFGATTGRLGVRAESNRELGGVPLQGFVSVDFWHDFTTSDTITFQSVPVSTAIGGTSVEIRGGLTAQVTDSVGVYGAVGYTTNLGGEERQIITGNLGLSIRW